MERGRKKVSKKPRGIYIAAGTAAILLILCATFFAVRLRAYATQGNVLTDIPDSITIDGRTYTKDKPMIILEVVPDLSMGNLGYMVGGSSNPVLAEDVRTVLNLLGETQESYDLKNAWEHKVQLFSNYIGAADVKTDTISNFEDRNFFANAVFGNSCMSDKMKVVVVKANELSLVTEENGTVAFHDSVTNLNYDPGMIYIHENKSDTKSVYDLMAKYNAQFGLNMKYQLNPAVKFTDDNNKYNLRGDVAYEIYLRAVKDKKTALMVDGTIVKNQPSEGDNVSKLLLLTRAITQDAFNEMFAQKVSVANGMITTSGSLDDYGLKVSGRVEAGATTWDIIYSGVAEGIVQNVYGTTSCPVCGDCPDVLKVGDKYDNAIAETKVTWGDQAIFYNTRLSTKYNVNITYTHDHTNGAKWEKQVYEQMVWRENTYPFFQPAMGNLYLSGKILQINGDMFTEMSILSGVQYGLSDKNYGTDELPVYATDYRNVEKDSNGNIKNSDIVKFILGGTPTEDKQDVQKLNVLEIEPSSDYKYTTYDSAKKIMSYFKNATFPQMTAENYTDYINVKSVSSVEFNGMNEDIIEMYDLIIVSDNNVAGIITPAVINNQSYIYYAKGQVLTLIESKMSKLDKNNNVTYSMAASGNDLTDKAYEELEQYAVSGKPMILASCIYNSGGSDLFQTIADLYKEDINMYKLSAAYLKEKHADKDFSNIVAEPTLEEYDKGKYSKVTYRVTPVVTVDTTTTIGLQEKAFKCSYNEKTGLVDTEKSFSASDLSDFAMSGKIGTQSAKTYGVRIYFDKDGNGIYSEDRNSEQVELFFEGNVTTSTDGAFNTQKFKLPETLRGYVRWKMVVTDLSSGYSSEDTGGIVIAYGENEHTIVNVLQIYPAENGTNKEKNLDMNSDIFKNAFNSDVTNITGYTLNVTSVSSNTYSKSYNELEYDLSNYDMVVMGFADDYNVNDLSKEAMDKIVDFVHQGKSLLMSHDTLLYTSYSDGDTINKQWAYNGKTHSYNITSAFRALAGMDAYGVTTSQGRVLQYQQGFSNYFLSKYATLNGGKTDYEYKLYGGQSDVKTAENIMTDRVDKLNIGQVTEYPYQIADTIAVAPTHGQWFQLDLEKQDSTGANDVVVWYTLGQTSSSSYKDQSKYYSLPGQDAAQNYYIYSKGNITYSGAGHSKITGKSELQLFVNTIIKAITAGNNAPKVVINNAVDTGSREVKYEQFIHDIDNDAEETISFTISDIDMGASTIAAFPLVHVFWDVDKDGRYTEGKDVILNTYENSIMNRTENILPLASLNNSGNSYSYDGVTFEQALRSNSVAIGIVAYDSKGAYGQNAVHLIYRNYFKLN